MGRLRFVEVSRRTWALSPIAVRRSVIPPEVTACLLTEKYEQGIWPLPRRELLVRPSERIAPRVPRETVGVFTAPFHVKPVVVSAVVFQVTSNHRISDDAGARRKRVLVRSHPSPSRCHGAAPLQCCAHEPQRKETWTAR